MKSRGKKILRYRRLFGKRCRDSLRIYELATKLRKLRKKGAAVRPRFCLTKREIRGTLILFTMKELPIIFSRHGEESARKRGANREEVERVIRSVAWIGARKGRQEAKLDFPFNAEWNNTFYKTKQVNPIFVVEKGEIVVITVYVFYF